MLSYKIDIYLDANAEEESLSQNISTNYESEIVKKRVDPKISKKKTPPFNFVKDYEKKVFLISTKSSEVKELK